MRDQLLKMIRNTRLSRALHNMKSGLMRSQFDKELFDLRNSFRNNATVQDRLIDAEKRESSLKAELYKVQEEKATVDQKVNRLQAELESFRGGSSYIQKFKENDHKKLKQFELLVSHQEKFEYVDKEKLMSKLEVQQKEIDLLRSSNKE